MLTKDDSRDPGWIAMRCVNHPTLRWTRKDPEAMKGCISQNPQIMFDGDMDNPDGKVHPFVSSENQLREMAVRINERHPDEHFDADAEIAKLKEQGYVFECPCPYGDLEYVTARGTEAADNAPKTKAEFDAVINRIRHEQQDALGIPRD